MLASAAGSVVRWSVLVAGVMALAVPGTAAAETVTLSPSLSCRITSEDWGECGVRPTVYDWSDRDNGRWVASHGLVRFDVASALPAGAIVESAEFDPNIVAHEGPPEVSYGPSGVAWTQNVTWTTSDGSTPWPTSAPPFDAYDTTEAVRLWHSGEAPNGGFRIAHAHSSISIQGGPSATVDPRLTIHYTTTEDIAPAADADGYFVEREGGYVGPGTHYIVAEGDDAANGRPVSGIRRLEVIRNGALIASKEAPCSPGCPGTFSWWFGIDTRIAAEGPLDLVVRAVDAVGNSDERLISVILDKTVPSPPSRIALEGFNAAQGTATLDWIEGDDPDLPGEDPTASGTESTDIRRQNANGTWGPWLRYRNVSDAKIYAVSEGQQLHFELRAVDAAGNISSTATARVTVVPDPPAPSYDPSEDPSAQGMDADFFCLEKEIDYSRRRVELPDHHRFKPYRDILGAQLRLGCRPELPPDLTAHIKGRFAYLAGEEDGEPYYVAVGEEANKYVGVKPGRTVKVRGFNAICEAQMAGLKEYVLFGQIRYGDGPIEGLRADASAADWTEWFDWNTSLDKPAYHRCPRVSTLHGRQLAGWKFLTRYSVEYLTDENKTARRSPGHWLGDALGNPPWVPPGVTPRGGWQAHHIMPAGSKKVESYQALLYRACVHPNLARNGVYLRARPLRRTNTDGTPNRNYQRLEQYDRENNKALAQRTYHGDTFRDSYYDNVKGALRAQERVEGQTCDSGGLGGHDDILNELSTLRNWLIGGMFLPPGPQN